MSDDQPTKPPPPRPSSGGQGCVTALLIVIGILLLLPGICSVFFIAGGMSNGLAALGLFVSVGGIALIVVALSAMKRP